MSISILVLEKDLFFAVKMRDTLKHHAMEVKTVRALPAFEQHLTVSDESRPVLAIINTATTGVDWEAAIRAARAQNLPVLCFGSHMDLEARARALEAGASKVVANSKFARDMPGLITRLLQQPAGVPQVDESEEDESEEIQA